MELTKSAILANKELLSGLEGYLVIVSKIETNSHVNPDIAIESCKSLIEGLCLKALSLLSEKFISSKKIQSKCENSLPFLITISFDEVFTKFVEAKLTETLSKLVIETATEHKFYSISKERIKKQAVEVVGKISAIRNERGDISHGRSYPKSIESDIALAKSIMSITDGICSFMIHEIANQYKLKLKEVGKLDFDELTDFNNWLDEKHAILSVKLDFSKLLYENAYDKYEEYYSEYIDIVESEKTVEEISDNALTTEEIDNINREKEIVIPAPFSGDPIVATNEYLEKSKKQDSFDSDAHYREMYDLLTGKHIEEKKEVVQLVGDFDENTFWTENRNVELVNFAESYNLKIPELKEFINKYYFTKKEPRRDEVEKVMIYRPSLEDRRAELLVMLEFIIELADKLKEIKE
jgi:hypothetical protein